MRWLLIALLAACSSTSTHYRHDTRIGRDKLYVVIERETTTTTSALDPADRTFDSEVDTLGIVEVDLATARCTARSGTHAMQRGDSGLAAFTGTPELRVEEDALAHASGARATTYGRPLVAGDRIFFLDRSHAWVILDRGLRVLDTIVLPLGHLVGIAPETAVFWSPLGTIPFRGDQSGVPVKGPAPQPVMNPWWHRQRPLAPGDEVVTPHGHRLRAVDDAGRLELDIVWARGHHARHPATRLVYFERSELVSLGDAVVDLAAGDAIYPIAVAEAFSYTRPTCCDGTYFLLANGELWHTTVQDRRRTVRPLRASLSLVAIRGDRLVFQSNQAIALYDLRTRRWILESYRECLPKEARD